MNHEGGDLDSAIARNMDDVRSLENQIRNLLKTLELVHDLVRICCKLLHILSVICCIVSHRFILSI